MRRIIDKKGLKDRGIDYSNVHLLRLERDGLFPRRFYLTQNRANWWEHEIDAHVEQCAAARDPMPTNDPAEAPADVGATPDDRARELGIVADRPARRRGPRATRREAANAQRTA